MRTKMSFSKQILSIFLCLALMLTYVPSTAFAATNTYDFSTSQSVLTINSSNKDQYDGATITGSYTLYLGSDILVIDGVTVNLTIEDLTLNTTGANTEGYSPIDLRNNATLNLTVKGTNTLSAEYHAAGIHVPAGCTLNITADSDGTLTVNGGGGYGGGAGIGADGNGYTEGYGSTTQTCGIINIAGGTIIATGGGHYVMGQYSMGGAGIGGSTTGTEGGVASTGSITISGGNVTATGGGQAAGIGGGGSGYVQSITITGGTVTAKAEYGAAIGSGSDSSATATFIDCQTAISITGGTVTADGNIGYGGSRYGTMSGGSLTIDPGASVSLTDGHVIDHDNVGNYAIIPVTLNVYDGRLTDTTKWVTMDAAQSGNRVGGAGVELAVSNYHGTAKLNFVVPAANATGETNFTVTGDSFTVTGSVALTTSGVTVTCGQQLYPVTLTFLDDDKFTSATNNYAVSNLTVTTDGDTPAGGTIMATLPNTIKYHSASMGTMVVWLAAGTYEISVTQSNLKADGAMTDTITVTGSATLNLLNNTNKATLGTLDLSYGPIKFYADSGAYKVDYYATSSAAAATTAEVLVSAPFVVTQSNSDTTITTNTITVTDWGTDVPLDLTIDGLNIETSTALSKDNNEGHIDINGSAVNLNLSGSSSLKSTYGTYADVTAALVSVDGTSSLTIDGTGSLTVNTNAYGAAIGGDQSSTVGTITIKGGTVTSTNTGIGAAIGTGYAGTSGGHAVITIEGGTVTANGDGGSRTAIGAAVSQGNNVNTASVTIKGGEVNATGIIGASQSSATVEISGGTVNATANTSGATIGGDVYYKTVGENMSVTISGGTVTATNTGKGPAIGGSGVSDKYAAATNKTAGKVTISGGTVTATNSSNTAAAIGASGGYYFDRTDVTISGGRVTATNNATNGVAIGGGYITSTSYTDPYTYSDVTITGGTVAATGVIGSAAKVAGPESTQYATVTITGGSVNGDVWAYSDESTNVGATNSTNPVYMITANLSSTVGTDAKVTSASITGNTSYGFYDVYTDADGKIYLWLPYTGSEATATFGGADYTGEVKTDNTGVFTIDCDHSGNTNKPNDNGDGTHDATCSDCGAMVVDNEEHTLTCSASDNTITVSCSINCGYTGTATISATSKTYDGTAAEVIVTKTGDLESENIAITYAVKDGEALTEAPVNADTYTASITLGDKTVSVEFTIAPVTITADMITVNSTVYNGETQIPKSNHVTVTVGGVVLEHNVDYSIGVYPDHEFINAYEYPITIYGEGNYTGSVETTFNIKAKSLTDGMVTISGDVNYSGSEQKPTVTVKDGTEALIEGTDYTVSFPEDMTNAGAKTITITGKGNYSGEITKTFTIVDETEPTGEILIKNNSWKQFLNWVTFGIFCKDNVDVTITADGTGSGIAKVEYLLSGTALDENNLPTEGWAELTANDGKYSFSIKPQNKTAVYVRITDEYDNVTVINSDGIVVYKDSEAVTNEVTYTYQENSDKDIAVTFNGNTVKSIVCSETTLVAGSDYTVDYDNGKIVLNAAYLNTLNASDTAYIFTVSYDPMGVANSGVTDLADTTFTVKVNKAQISTVTVDVTSPEAGEAKQTDVADGTGYSAAISWNCDTEKFGYNTAYTATVTLTADGNHKFASDLTASGWNVVVSADGTTATLTKTFVETRKEKLTAISAPTDSTLNKYYTDVADAIKELPTTVVYTTESGSVTVNIEWDCSNYDYAVTKTNTFTWKVKDGELTNYDENNIATTGTITVTNASAITVNNSGENKTVTYSGSTYDVVGMFTIDKNAGEASYAITGGTGAGTLNGSVLTITKAGTIEIKLTTAANGAYAAGEATATLTVNKGAGSGIVTIEGWTYGEDANAPIVNSSTNGNASVTYLYESTDGKGYTGAVAPENAGSYKLTVIFAETDLYEACTDDATFTIEQKKITASITGSVSKVYDGTNTVPNGHGLSIALSEIGTDDVTATASFAYDGVNVGTTKVNATGITLSGADAGNYKLTATSVSADIGEITKATPQYDVPTGLTATYGDTLVDVTLPEGFTWEDALTTAVGNVGNREFTVTYTPDDTTNFNTVTGIEVSIEVKAAAASVATAPTAISGLIYNKTAQALIAAGTANGGEMQYSLSKDSGYSTTIPTGTGAGTYTVWYKVVGDSNHSDTAPVSIEIKIGKADPAIGTVTAGVVNDTLEISAIELDRSNTVVDGVLSVDAGQELKLGDNQIAYTFTPADTNNYETVTGKVTVTVKDTIAPTGKVEFVNRTGWESFVNTITFGLFYKDEVTVKAEANDSFSGINSIEYAASDKAMTLDEVKAITDWTAMPTNGVGVTVEDTKQFVYFVRITDNAGNVTYLSTDGAEYDITVPVISGIENGKTYYTTQKVTVSDKNLDTVTLNGEPVTGTITLDGNKDATYTIVATDKAGNSTTVTVTMKPISDLSQPIDTLTKDNVNSSNEQAVDNVKAAVEAVDTTNATDAEKEALKAITDKVAELEKVIDDTKAEITRINDELKKYDGNTVNSDDAEALEQLGKDIKALTDGGNLTDAEKAALTEAASDVAEMQKTVEDTVAENKRISDAVDGYDLATVTSEDKADLEQLLADINKQLESTNLTEEEISELNGDKKAVEDLLTKIKGTDELIDKLTEDVDGYSEDTVKSTDKDAIEQIIEDIDALLETENLTEDEKKALEDAKAKAEDLLDAIDEAAQAPATDNTEKVKDVTAENVTPEDKTNLENAKADLEKALEENGGNYTEDEKKAIEDEIKRIEDALKVIENVEAVEDQINNLPENITKDDTDDVDAAKKAYDGLSDYEKTLIDPNTKKKLEAAIKAAEEANKPADTDSPQTGDNTNMPALFALMFGSLAAMLAVIFGGKKKKKAEDK